MRYAGGTFPGSPSLPSWFNPAHSHHFASLASSLVGALAVLLWRMRETRRPVSVRSIVLPPLAMSTGFLMFVRPEFRVPWAWAVGAFVLGATVFGYPLLRTSEMRREGDVVMLRRSRAFLLILLGLVGVRLLLHDSLDYVLPMTQTAALFFILAFGMIVRWRTWMLAEYRRLTTVAAETEAASA